VNTESLRAIGVLVLAFLAIAAVLKGIEAAIGPAHLIALVIVAEWAFLAWPDAASRIQPFLAGFSVLASTGLFIGLHVYAHLGDLSQEILWREHGIIVLVFFGYSGGLASLLVREKSISTLAWLLSASVIGGIVADWRFALAPLVSIVRMPAVSAYDFIARAPGLTPHFMGAAVLHGFATYAVLYVIRQRTPH
jgi:hypothetical protein